MLRKKSYYDALIGKRQGSITILGIGKIATEIIVLKIANGYLWKIKSTTNEVQDS